MLSNANIMKKKQNVAFITKYIKETGTKHVIFLFERSQRKTGTALQCDSGFSYAHRNGCFYTYVKASF